MLESPWISSFNIKPEPELEYIVVITYLPLKSYLSFFEFFKHVRFVQEQLQQTHGFIGFKLRADILTKKSYTMSVWEDAGSLKKFITSGTHGDLMSNCPEYLGDDRKFITVFIPGSDYPPCWEWAMEKLKNN